MKNHVITCDDESCMFFFKKVERKVRFGYDMFMHIFGYEMCEVTNKHENKIIPLKLGFIFV
jgi:hypothetical protein